MKAILTIVSATCMLFFAACITESQTCISTETAYLDSVFVPKTGLVNQDIPISFFYGVHNGCGKFIGFNITEEGNTQFCQVKVEYNGCQCTAIYFTENKIYNFKTAATGSYYFKYLRGANVYTTDTLVVN